MWIYQGFCGFEVRFYLAVAKREEGLVVAFPVGFPFNALGRRYAGGEWKSRVASLSEVAVEAPPVVACEPTARAICNLFLRFLARSSQLFLDGSPSIYFLLSSLLNYTPFLFLPISGILG